MTLLFAHPFHISPGGNVAVWDDTSDEHRAEQLSVLITTKLGERQLVPAFGLNDPTFSTFSMAALQIAVEMFGPDVNIVSVDQVYINDTDADVFVEFE